MAYEGSHVRTEGETIFFFFFSLKFVIKIYYILFTILLSISETHFFNKQSTQQTICKIALLVSLKITVGLGLGSGKVNR